MFANEGAKVAVTHRPGKDADALVASLAGDGHAAFACDVGDSASIAALKAAVTARYGGLDVLVNTAGFTKAVPHHDLDALDDDLIDRHVRGQLARPVRHHPRVRTDAEGQRRTG